MHFLVNLTIRQKLTIVISVISAIALGIFASVTITDASRDARRELTNQALLLSEVGVNALEAPMVFKDKRSALEMLAILGVSTALVAADIHDTNGNIFAEIKLRSFDSPNIHQHHGGMPNSIETEFHHSTLHVGRPIKSDGKIVGFLHQTFDLSNKLASLRNKAFIAILMATGLLIISVLLAFAFSRILTDPILKLTSTMREITSSNDFSHQLEIESHDEVGELTSGFNSMLSGLAQREFELEAYREDLEQLVEERTQELGETNKKLKAQIAQREHVELELRKAKNQAEEASQAKSDFIATLSHEIRTPMNGVLGMAGLLSATTLDDQQTHYVSRIRQSGILLLNLLNEILDIAKIESGQLQLESTDFEIESMLAPVIGSMQSRASENGLVLATDIPSDIPKVLKGDPTRIGQILFNLAGNAIKFTKEGSITIRASHQPIVEGRIDVRFEVIDTGVGIPMDRQKDIFNKFAQADSTTTRRFGGTGLGLAICTQLVEMMGGCIGVESSPGEGSTFWFSIPCEIGDPRALSDDDDPWTFEGKFAEEGQTQKRVLVAEDNVVNQEIVAQILKNAGFAVDVVANGMEAVEAVRGFSYDIILMDVHMPEMDGVEATRKIRQLPGPESQVPIIALTADAMSGDREKLLKAGMNDHAAKPIKPKQLFSSIALLINRQEDPSLSTTAI